MDIEEHLDDIAQEFFSLWKIWHLDKGWTLGMNLPDSKMSPYLVRSWNGLDDSGKAWFRQQVALVIHAAKPYRDMAALLDIPQPDKARQKAIMKLQAGMKAFDADKLDVAKRKTRTALKLLKGDSIRKHVS